MTQRHIIASAFLVIVAVAIASCGNSGKKNDNKTGEKVAEKVLNNRLLIIVDPQVDFTTGSLAVAKGPETMTLLAEAVEKGVWKKYNHIVVTQDNHPANHCSFVEQGGRFPPHCVQGTEGATVYPLLQEKLTAVSNDITIHYLTKGDLVDKEEFSIFQNEKNAAVLTKLIDNSQFDGIDICGIATDYCVFETLTDLLAFYPAHKVRVVTNCIAAVDESDTKLAELVEKEKIETVQF